jgi:hypothetical protein
MFDQPLSQCIKARSGPGGIFLILPEIIENLLKNFPNQSETLGLLSEYRLGGHDGDKHTGGSS